MKMISSKINKDKNEVWIIIFSSFRDVFDVDSSIGRELVFQVQFFVHGYIVEWKTGSHDNGFYM